MNNNEPTNKEIINWLNVHRNRFNFINGREWDTHPRSVLLDLNHEIKRSSIGKTILGTISNDSRYLKLCAMYFPELYNVRRGIDYIGASLKFRDMGDDNFYDNLFCHRYPFDWIVTEDCRLMVYHTRQMTKSMVRRFYITELFPNQIDPLEYMNR